MLACFLLAVALAATACSTAQSTAPTPQDICHELTDLLGRLHGASMEEVKVLEVDVQQLVHDSLALAATGNLSFKDQANMLEEGRKERSATTVFQAFNDYLTVCELNGVSVAPIT